MAEPSGVSGRILADAARSIGVIVSGAGTLDGELDRAVPEYRRALAHLLLNFFKHRRFLDGELARLAPRTPPARIGNLLRAALTQIYFQRSIAAASAVNIAVDTAGRRHSGFVNAVLRRAVAERRIPPEKPEEVFPEVVLTRWRERFPAEVLNGFAAALLAEPEFTFRSERGMVPPPSWQAEPISAAGGFEFYAMAEPERLFAGEEFRRGDCYVQDPAAALAPSLLPVTDGQRALRALDMCAAPGGKALMLLERLNDGTQLVLADRSAARQRQTRENFARRGLLGRVEIVVEDGTNPAGVIGGDFQVVLLDVPCSNTGVFRRRPDALWRFSVPELRRTVELQRRLLERAAGLTAPGGVLIYSTCSIELEENSGQVYDFVARHPEFVIECEQELLPGREHDGAFASRLRRQ